MGVNCRVKVLVDVEFHDVEDSQHLNYQFFQDEIGLYVDQSTIVFREFYCFGGREERRNHIDNFSILLLQAITLQLANN